MDKKMKQQQSKSEYGTMTAKFDANGEYGTSAGSQSGMSSMSSSVPANAAGSQQSSKSKYGTLTAKADANNDYE